jgi:hypothetical protein
LREQDADDDDVAHDDALIVGEQGTNRVDDGREVRGLVAPFA